VVEARQEDRRPHAPRLRPDRIPRIFQSVAPPAAFGVAYLCGPKDQLIRQVHIRHPSNLPTFPRGKPFDLTIHLSPGLAGVKTTARIDLYYFHPSERKNRAAPGRGGMTGEEKGPVRLSPGRGPTRPCTRKNLDLQSRTSFQGSPLPPIMQAGRVWVWT